MLANGARTTSNRFWQSVDQRKQPSMKPYTARIVPPLLVGDQLQKSHPQVPPQTTTHTQPHFYEQAMSGNVVT